MSWLRSPTSSNKKKRRPRQRTFPCKKKPGGYSCRWAAPAQANRLGTSARTGTHIYCLGCHIDPDRNQRGLTEEELKRFSSAEETTPAKTRGKTLKKLPAKLQRYQSG